MIFSDYSSTVILLMTNKNFLWEAIMPKLVIRCEQQHLSHVFTTNTSNDRPQIPGPCGPGSMKGTCMSYGLMLSDFSAFLRLVEIDFRSSPCKFEVEWGLLLYVWLLPLWLQLLERQIAEDWFQAPQLSPHDKYIASTHCSWISWDAHFVHFIKCVDKMFLLFLVWTATGTIFPPVHTNHTCNTSNTTAAVWVVWAIKSNWTDLLVHQSEALLLQLHRIMSCEPLCIWLSIWYYHCGLLHRIKHILNIGGFWAAVLESGST